MVFKNTHVVIFFLIISISSQSQGLRTLGKNIINSNGDEVLLKGVGLGGWMLQEGYMMNSSGGADTQHEFIEKLTTKLIYHEKSIDHICCFGLNRLCIIL